MAVDVGRCHVDAGIDALVVAGHQLGQGVQVLQGIVGSHVLVSELLERAIKPFGHGGLGFSLGGIVVDAILVQQLFDVLVVKLCALIGLQLDGVALTRLVFQQMAQGVAHGRAALTLQAHHSGILAQDVDDGEQVARAPIVLDQFGVLHFHQIGLPGMIDGRAHHRLATGKALTLRAVQGEGEFAAQVSLSGGSSHAQRSGGTQQLFDIAAQGIRTVLVQKQPL